jgi:ParB family chromosome partitioning protein
VDEVISVSPFLCRMWVGHERLEDQINEATCQDEIKSMLNHGQLLPVLGRRLRRDVTHEFEIIYGARRLFVTQHLNMPLLLKVREFSDREATIAVEIENRHRKELSPYERGCAYSRWIRAGLFVSQDELACHLNVSPSQVSRLVRLANIPASVVSAFPSPLDICENWGKGLAELCQDPNNCRALAEEVGAIRQECPRATTPEIYERLTSGARTRVARAPRSDDYEVVRDDCGHPLYRILQRQSEIELLLPIPTLSSSSLDEIKCAIAEILQRAHGQAGRKRNLQTIRMPVSDRTHSHGTARSQSQAN